MTTEQDERYVQSQERIATAMEAYMALHAAFATEEPPEILVPTSQKMSEIEQLAYSVARLKELKISNPSLIELIDQAIEKEGLSLTDPDVLAPLVPVEK